MKVHSIISALVLLTFVSQTVLAQQADRDPMAPVAQEPEPSDSETVGTLAKPKVQPSELDLPEDPTVKIKVEPVIVGNLVDRVAEPALVTVECPQATSAEVYLVPVDAPYGGRALARPRLIGKDPKATDGLTVSWGDKEQDQYVKLFAVVRKRNEARVRSHTIDLAMFGARYKPAAAETQPAPAAQP